MSVTVRGLRSLSGKDPATYQPHMLHGEGKTMRHVKFKSVRELERPFVRRYIRAAMEQAAPPGTRGTGDGSRRRYLPEPDFATTPSGRSTAD